MSTATPNTATPTIDALESRQMFAATVVGYLPDWEATKSMVDRIDYSTVTQLDYFSVIPNSSGKLPGTAGGPAANSMSGYSLDQLKYAVTKAHSKGVKVNIVIGGAGDAPTNAIETVIASGTKRTAFASSLKAFCAKYNVDGVDFDYEPAGPSDAQIANYGHLIKTVNDTVPAKLKLSAAVAAETLPTGDDWDRRRYVLGAEAVKNLDQIGVMTYDFTPGQGHADLNRSLKDLGDWTTYVKSIPGGGTAAKLTLGLPFYGRAGSSDWENPGNAAEGSYAAIVRSYALDHDGALPAASANSLNVWLGEDVANGEYATYYFDGPARIQQKTTEALRRGAGGVMIWDLGQDHFKADGKYDSAHSLLPAVKRGVAAAQARSASPAGTSLFSSTPVAATRAVDALFGDAA